MNTLPAFARYIHLIAPCMGKETRRYERASPHAPRLTDEQKAAAIAECLRTGDRKATAQRYGIHPDTLTKWLVKAGKQRTQERRGPEAKARAKELRQAGLSYREIGEQMGIPKATVQMWLRGLA